MEKIASVIDLPPKIAEALIDNGMVTFKVISWCMFPLIWAQDTLKIETINPQDARIGDIIFYKHAGRAFAHRLARTYTENNRLYMVTTGEEEFRKREFSDGRNGVSCGIPLDNILGRVSEIKRGKSCFKPEEANESFISLTQGRIKLFLSVLRHRVKQYLVGLIKKLALFKDA